MFYDSELNPISESPIRFSSIMHTLKLIIVPHSMWNGNPQFQVDLLNILQPHQTLCIYAPPGTVQIDTPHSRSDQFFSLILGPDVYRQSEVADRYVTVYRACLKKSFLRKGLNMDALNKTDQEWILETMRFGMTELTIGGKPRPAGIIRVILFVDKFCTVSQKLENSKQLVSQVNYRQGSISDWLTRTLGKYDNPMTQASKWLVQAAVQCGYYNAQNVEIPETAAARSMLRFYIENQRGALSLRMPAENPVYLDIQTTATKMASAKEALPDFWQQHDLSSQTTPVPISKESPKGLRRPTPRKITSL